MNRISAIIWCSCLSLLSLKTDAEQANDFQAQLQRLQTAVTQSRQAGNPTGAPPTFNPNSALASGGGVPPPVTPSPGPLNAQVNAQATVPTLPPNLGNGTAPLPPGAGPVGGGAAPATTLVSPTGPEGVNLRDQAFSETSDNLLPLTPDQVRTLHGLFSGTQRAVAEAPGIPPRPTSAAKIVNLAPGATPPIIRLSAGFVSSLVFLDASGAAWPIDSYDLGDPRSYNIQWDKKSNMLLVQAITEFKTGNLAVMLRGLNTPVMLTLIPGQRAVDYRVDLRIPGLGPNAAPAAMPETLPGASNPILLDVLNGVPPPGSRALSIAGRDCQVWLLNGKLYVRTRLTVLSPGWISTLSSADGMHAYEMQQTPVILASENGKMVKLTIQGL
jgi:intracellular multiplication protein IcmK